ncbi:pentatricopeptide repeat-containing protein At1g06710, mitochondrial-like [Arachis stenosperma]|uniref:pentatricopeptide repeat-containing protein At1g06710, mitochondrial-like n=1 Tax=Arachis stenosperma TaxID=217475 RepID=UPI0025ACABB8|nr:pentatricopeptide repeat-containing protein At1g06710, mitochondrial-like [Arachis stenosperma]
MVSCRLYPKMMKHVVVPCQVPLESIMHSNELQWLACGPNVQVSRFTSYNVNGFKFRTLSREERLKAQNSRVHVTFDTRSYASKRNNNVAVGSILYYGKLVDIIELNYSGKLEERDLFLRGSSFSLCKAIEEASTFSSLEHATSIERDLFNKLPIRAWLDAFSAHRHIGVVLYKVNVGNFARCLCRAGKFDKAFMIICEIMSKDFVPDDSRYSTVIHFLCNAFKVDKAFLLFEEIKRNGIVSSVYTYTILIGSFCKAGLIQQARKWCDEMLRYGCTANVVTYTVFIHAYLKARKLSDANKLFEVMMVHEGCMPNIATYIALIDGHCKAGQIEKTCQIFVRTQSDIETSNTDMYFKLDDDNNTEEPNVITYGALVDGLCKTSRVKQARE